MAINMKRKFDKYWGDFDKMNILLYVGLVLDPRYKLRYVEYTFGSMYDVEKTRDLTKKVKDVLIYLYQFHQKESGSGGVQENSGSQTVGGSENSDDSDPRKLRQLEWKRRLLAEETLESKSEVEKYLVESVEEDRNEFDILTWWQVNSSKYKVLSCVARDVLAISVSTVASKSVLSTGSRVIDSYRTSLSPKVAEALICAQNWLCSSSNSIDLKFKEAMDEVDEIEKLTAGIF